jgi:3-oxoadipate enol-lactonase
MTEPFVRQDGPADAPALLLCHSLGTDHRMWESQIPAFTQHFRVVRYDLRGHGASPAPSEKTTIDDLGRDALSVMDRLGQKRFHFCGLSTGGLVGQWLALNAPERLNRLMLCNTAARIGSAEMWSQRIETVRSGGMEAVTATVADRWFTEDFGRRFPAVLGAARATLLATSPAGYNAICSVLRDADFRPRVAAIKIPTLVIAGDKDLSTPPADGRWLAQQISGAGFTVLAAAHLSNLERPDEFSAAAIRFLHR